MALANPIRLEVHKRMTEVLKEITVANGYASDIGDNVFRGRIVFGEETPIPSLAILEVPIPIDQLPSPRSAVVTKGPWELMVQGWVKDDRDNPTDNAHILMADVKKRLIQERAKIDEGGIFGLPRNVLEMYIGAGVVRPPEEISAKAYFWLTITLEFSENLADPYSE
jgi:hypothetical protein